VIVPELKIDRFYRTNETMNEYGGTVINQELQKTKLYDYLCDSLDLGTRNIDLHYMDFLTTSPFYSNNVPPAK
jgi:hypothetical protein